MSPDRDRAADRPKALDLFCGAGGAAMGLHRAGFDVTGIDNRPQPRFPFRFIQADALKPPVRLEDFDLVWASPPCQFASWASGKARNQGKVYPNLIPETRAVLESSGRDYVIENVIPARPHLRAPFTLCGLSFGLGVVRHRLFETSFFVMVPGHHRCAGAVQEQRALPVYGNGIASYYYGNPAWRGARALTVAGNDGNSLNFQIGELRKAMGIDWMSKKELTQSIPPAYSEHIGRYAMIALGRVEA